jgi:hypothetical protein
MSRAEHLPRLRRASLCVFALLVLAFAVALVAIGLGIALLIAGLLSWLHPVDVAAAWARTLAGIGVIGGSTALAALGWLALGGVAPLLEEFARLRYSALSPDSRTLKFIAVIGILLALICLPFAAGIHASAHGPWLGA